MSLSLIQIAFLFFAAIAAGGLLMAGMIVGKIKIPGFLGPAHGLGGLAALAFLFYVNLQSDATPDRAWWALGVFTAGLIGGLLFFRVLYKNAAPLFLVAGHGSVAALGLWLLYPVAFAV
ncbi:MAG: hypothetical protein ACT4QA_21945 [Panacagrimonas sp.]